MMISLSPRASYFPKIVSHQPYSSEERGEHVHTGLTNGDAPKCPGLDINVQAWRKRVRRKEREIQLTPISANSPGCTLSDHHPQCQMTPVKVCQLGCPWQKVIL